MQPRPSKSRPIRRELRPDGPLVLRAALRPDPRDAREGRRPAALWRRSASGTRRGSRSSRCICSAIRRTRATPRRSRSRSSSSGSASSAARPQFSTWLHRLVVNTCKDLAQARARAAHRAAARGRARRRATAIRSRRSPPPRRGASSAAASPSCRAAQATVVALKDAFDLGFAEISSATGLPVGTAKCYAHRGRGRPARTAVRMSARPRQAEIEAIIPHRDPFLLVDEVLELVPGERVVARKTVTEHDCAGPLSRATRSCPA